MISDDILIRKTKSSGYYIIQFFDEETLCMQALNIC